MLFRGKIPHGFFRERREGSGEETPWRSCLIAQHHPPGHGSCGWTAGSRRGDGGHWVLPVLDQGWGMSRRWDREGKAHPRRDKLAPLWLDSGWRGGGQPQCPPREVPVGCEGAGKCRRWGGEGEGRREDVSEVSWSAGAGQGLAAALQGCREGSGGDVGARGCALAGLGLLHPACSLEALASFMRCR